MSNQTVVRPLSFRVTGNHNQTVVRPQPALFPTHNQTVVRPLSFRITANHNQAVWSSR